MTVAGGRYSGDVGYAVTDGEWVEVLLPFRQVVTKGVERNQGEQAQAASMGGPASPGRMAPRLAPEQSDWAEGLPPLRTNMPATLGTTPWLPDANDDSGFSQDDNDDNNTEKTMNNDDDDDLMPDPPTAVSSLAVWKSRDGSLRAEPLPPSVLAGQRTSNLSQRPRLKRPASPIDTIDEPVIRDGSGRARPPPPRPDMFHRLPARLLTEKELASAKPHDPRAYGFLREYPRTRFVDDLVSVSCRRTSLTPALYTTAAQHTLFEQCVCDLVDKTTLPPSLETKGVFNEGERVLMRAPEKMRRIVSDEQHGYMVDDGGGQTVFVPFKLAKRFAVIGNAEMVVSAGEDQVVTVIEELGHDVRLTDEAGTVCVVNPNRLHKIFDDFARVDVVVDGDVVFSGWAMNPKGNEMIPKYHLFVTRRAKQWVDGKDGRYEEDTMEVR